MGFEVKTADSIADAKEIAQGVCEGFLRQEPFTTMFKDAEIEEFLEKLLPSVVQRLHGPGKETFKIVETESNKIVSFFTIQHPYTLTEEEKAKHPQLTTQTLMDVPKGTNIKLYIDVFALMGRIRVQYGFNPEVDYMGTMVGTHPLYQHQGHAKRLVKLGLRFADEAGKKWYAACWPASTKMYLDLGFVLQGEEVIDLSQYGGEGSVKMSLLTREPVPLLPN